MNRSAVGSIIVLAAAALALPLLVFGNRGAKPELPDGAAGRQAQWLIDASTQPLHRGRGHFSGRASSAWRDRLLHALDGARPLSPQKVLVTAPKGVSAEVKGQTGDRILSVVVDGAGKIAHATVNPPVALPGPSGRSAVGTDRLELVDKTRHGRHLMLTRWYPAAGDVHDRPRA